MPIQITMPALSPTMDEGTLARWLVKEGDTVESGDIIAEIETDKATMEVETIVEGVVAKLLVRDGSEGVKVGDVIALIAEEGEDPASLEVEQAATPPQPDKAEEGYGREADTPGANGDAIAPVSGNGSAAAPAPQPSAKRSAGERILASPLARRIAEQKGVDLSVLSGSGPRGRIIKRDVEAAEAGPALKPDAARHPVASPDGLILPQLLDDRVYDPDSYELKPLDGMRRTVARRLTDSFMQVPHFPLTIDLRLDRLLAARKAINAAAPEGVKISVNDMLIKAAAGALMAEPDCNASYSDAGIAYHNAAHVSVAVAVEGGLVTPVVRDAQSKGLRQISEEMTDLASRARDRRLKPHEYMGGTFSLSNLGMFGIKEFGSILNPPEGMILSVGAGEKRPVATEDGELAVATVMSVTLTCDHRVIGGAEGALWLQAFRRFVETPETLLL